MAKVIRRQLLTLGLALLALFFASCQSQRQAAAHWAHDCTRGVPEPIVAKSNAQVSKHSFRLRKIDAIEKITLKEGTQIEVRNWGCESYALSLKLFFPGNHTDPANAAMWYQSCSGTIRALQREGAAIDMVQVSEVLKQAIQLDGNLKYGTTHSFGGFEIPSTVSIAQVTSGPKGTMVLVEMVVGPL